MTVEFLSNIGMELFSSKNVWLLQTDDNILGNLYFPIDSQVFTFVDDEASIEIQEVYNVGQGTDRVVKQLGSWKKNGDCLREGEILWVTILKQRYCKWVLDWGYQWSDSEQNSDWACFFFYNTCKGIGD